ncbi:hypothetical protein ACF09G_12965 [Streptomyces albogriseolus]|uniref:hypothetical protein n=1 Tax=Streptomyces albogriseolus TaxID=1887 RepID=UPI00225095CA|nr:hypothetical protein [Streptomyces viridodiastaticus]MCX4622822.1 hypothetical protein [Streptomyces viridodiastaticus]
MTHQPADAVAQWNSRYPIGTPVTAYPGLRPEDDPAADRLITRTRSEAQALGGHTAVVWVDGHDACVALSHVDPVQPADTYTPPAKYQRSDGATCCPHATPVAPGSCEACWDLVKWNAVDARLIPSSPAAVSAAVAPPTTQAADEIRDQLLHAIDHAYTTGVLGYGSPEDLLAAYDNSRTPPADQTDPELTAEEARTLADELGLQLYRAQDALAFVAECCDIADREQRPVTTADVREWLKGARCGRQLAADAADQTAILDLDAIAARAADAQQYGVEDDGFEQLVREDVPALVAEVRRLRADQAADTGGFELRGDTEIRAAVLREAADRAEVVALRLRLKHDTGAANGAYEVMDELRRMADETPAASAPTHHSTRATPKTDEARQDEVWPVKEATHRYAESLRVAPGQASADGHAGWECDAGAQLLISATTPGPGALGTHHGTIYACPVHQGAALQRITGAGYQADPQPAPPGHRWNPWPCGHITAHDAQALTALTAAEAQQDGAQP